MTPVRLNAVFGENELIINADGKEIRVPFTLKYGVNIVPINYGGKIYKFRFIPKFGEQTLGIPVILRDTIYLDSAYGLSDLNSGVFTLINQIPESADSPTRVKWIKHRLESCGKKDGIFDKSSGHAAYKSGTWTAFLNMWQKYRPPLWTEGGYYSLSVTEQAQYFTAGIGDLLIFADIPDEVPASIVEFDALKRKYKDQGGCITGTEAYIKYKPNGKPWKTNHIEVTKS